MPVGTRPPKPCALGQTRGPVFDGERGRGDYLHTGVATPGVLIERRAPFDILYLSTGQVMQVMARSLGWSLFRPRDRIFGNGYLH